jgi:hypothetical protein
MKPFLAGIAAIVVCAAVSIVAYDLLAVGSGIGFQQNPGVRLH